LTLIGTFEKGKEMETGAGDLIPCE